MGASPSDPKATVVYDPQRAVEGMGFQKHDEFLPQGEDRVNALIARPEDNDPGIIRRWIGPDVPRAAVECDEASCLAPAHFCDLRVCYTTKSLLKHRVLFASQFRRVGKRRRDRFRCQ